MVTIPLIIYEFGSSVFKATIGWIRGDGISQSTELAADSFSGGVKNLTVMSGSSVSVTITPATGYANGTYAIDKYVGGSISETITGCASGSSQSLANATAAHIRDIACGGIQYTATLNKMGGTGGAASVVVTYGSALPHVVPPTRTGYNFTGYYYSVSEENYYDANGDGLRAWQIAGNATLYAAWSPKSYTLTLDPNGGQIAGSSSAYVIAGGLIFGTGNWSLVASERQNQCVRAGYTLTGWYTAAEGGNMVYDANGKAVQGTYWTNSYDNGGEYRYDGNLTVYAHWTQWPTLTVESSSPSHPTPTVFPSPSSGRMRQGQNVEVTTPASGVEVVFKNWNATGITLTDEEKTSLELNFVMPNAAVSLTAVYGMKTFSVTAVVAAASSVAVAAGAGVSIVDRQGQALDPAAITYGTYVNITAPFPKGGEYAFSGWYDGSGTLVSGNQTYSISSLEGDVSLEARYTAKQTFGKSENGGTGSFSVDGTEYTETTSVTVSKVLGETMTIAAAPDENCYFAGWSKDGVATSLTLQASVTVDEANEYVAAFSNQLVTIKVTTESDASSESGSVGVLEVENVVQGEDDKYEVAAFSRIRLVATPSSSSDALPLRKIYRRSGVDLVQISNISPVEVDLANENVTFLARWGEVGRFTASVSTSGEGQGSALLRYGESTVASITAEEGVSLVAEAVPFAGSRFVGWYVNGNLISTQTRYPFSLNIDMALVAQFEEDDYAIFAWEGSSARKTLSWKSGVFTFPKPFDPVAARVDAGGYPVSMSVRTYSSPDVTSPLPVRDHALSVTAQGARRLGRMRPERYVQVSVESEHEVDSVVIASNIAEAN